MREKEQLFGLMVVAEEQQKSAQTQLNQLTQYTKTLQQVIGEFPEQVEKAACERLEAALSDEVSKTIQESCKGLKEASNGLERRLLDLSRQVESMGQQLNASMRWVTWRWLAVFFVGIVGGLSALMILVKIYLV